MQKNDKKTKSILQIKKAFAAAEDRRQESEDRYDEEIQALTERYLKKDNLAERKALLDEYTKGAPIVGTNGIRKKLGAIDIEYFGKAYFPHYFSLETPEFHRDLDRIWFEGVLKSMHPASKEAIKRISSTKGCRRAIAAPRGHAKSTNFTFKDTLHAVLYAYKHYILILSDSSEQAESFLENIREEIEENERIQEDFGNLVGKKAWRSNVLLTSTNIKIEAIGSGKKVRGRKHRNWRPDLILLDDIENDENVRTPEQRKKMENWYFKAVSKAGNVNYTDIVYIGTLLHYDSLLAKILKNPAYKSIKYRAVISFASNKELWDKWEAIYIDLNNENREIDARAFFQKHQEEMLEGTEVLWEEMLSYYDLMAMRVSEGEAAFNSEEQNEPINPEDCLFREDMFDFYNPAEIDFKEKRFVFFGFVDPSLGKTNKSDFSAIITLAKDKKTGYMYVMDADIKRRHPSKIIKDIIEKEKWLRKDFNRGYKRFGCETNQFQWFMKEKLAEESAAEGLYLPIQEISQRADKTMRIQTLEPDIQNKYLKFNRSHKLLLEQLQYFPMAAYDDGPDALEGCRTIAKKKSSIADGWR